MLEIRTHMSRHLLIFPAALLILGVFAVIARTPRLEAAAPPLEGCSPEGGVSRLVSAEQRGDSRAYRDGFILSQRMKLETLWQGRSQSQIGAELQKCSAGLVGRAITQVTFADPENARL